MDVTYTTTTVDGLPPGTWEAGLGCLVVLLHGGESAPAPKSVGEKTIQYSPSTTG